jgi:hypothetical protein
LVRPMTTVRILPANDAHLHYEELRFTVRANPIVDVWAIEMSLRTEHGDVESPTHRMWAPAKHRGWR